MTLKILHTADIHLGMRFTRGYEPDLREALIDARAEVLDRLVGIANERECDLIVIAGDLFHNTNPSPNEIVSAASSLSEFTGQVLILPGNHDYYDEAVDSLWANFAPEMGENTTILREPEVARIDVADQPVAIYPGPCYSTRSEENMIGWVAEARKETEADFHIGVAHGDLEGVTPDFDQEYFPMTRRELEDTGVPIWLLGHAHIRYPDVDHGSDELALFASTPEPDGFDCRHGGSVWVVTVEDENTSNFEAVQTGQYRFHEISRGVSGEADLKDIREKFSEFDSSKDLAKLKLEGRLKSDVYDHISETLEDLESQVLYLEYDLGDLLRQITQKDIDRIFTQESFPHRLLSTLAENEDDALALQKAYELINEVRS